MESLSCRLSWRLVAFFPNHGERALVSYQAAVFMYVLHQFYYLLVTIKTEVYKT